MDGELVVVMDNHKKKAIQALAFHKGVVTTACESIGLNRSTFYLWLNSDPEFKKMVDDVQDIAIDFVESKLFQNIQDNDTASIIFYLKTKGKKRGYVERTEITGKDGAAITVTGFQILTDDSTDQANS